MKNPDRSNILGMFVAQQSPTLAQQRILRWAKDYHGRYICVSNVHMCIETVESEEFKAIVNSADLVVSDSQVLAWALKVLGEWDEVTVVRGMDLMIRLCEGAERIGLRVGLYGGAPDSLKGLKEVLVDRFPDLLIVVTISPPFRALDPVERLAYVGEINQSGVNLLFVGLGCPKQERWMADNKADLKCTMIGVGAAFDFISGAVDPSPSWVHPMGLEWLWRLTHEPKRLWCRYARTNTKFIWLVIQQMLGRKF